MTHPPAQSPGDHRDNANVNVVPCATVWSESGSGSDQSVTAQTVSCLALTGNNFSSDLILTYCRLVILTSINLKRKSLFELIVNVNR